MRLIVCQRCGSNELIDDEGVLVCVYCRSRYAAPEASSPTTTIGVAADIEALLDKCMQEPQNRRRYASLILDLDPGNAEAIRYLT